MFFGLEPIIKELEGTKVEIRSFEFDITPDIQKDFTDVATTTKSLSHENKIIVYNILKDPNFYNNIPTKGKVGEMKDVATNFPKTLQNFLSFFLSFAATETED